MKQNTEQLLDQVIYTFKKWVTGYHIYQDIWTPEIGEILTWELDSENHFDDCAVSIISGGKLVGHVPRTISEDITNVLLAGVKLKLIVHANPKRTRWNGIIVPCTYVLEGSQSIIDTIID